VAMEQLAFARETADRAVVVVANSSASPASFDVAIPCAANGEWRDALNGDVLTASVGRLAGEVPSCWARILVRAGG
jgi:hypothetical protein